MTIQAARRIIAERVDIFARNREQYRADEYKEARLRREFLDPFFEALGWDVMNRQGWAEQYKEVVNEDALKIAGTTKAPDYSFRVGGVRKFFAEAKKPKVGLKTDGEAAYQLRRYAWSAQLPLSLLSDFEELAIYDCRARPAQTDKAAVGRIAFFTFDEYAERLPEIYDVFSKEAVLRGSFDQYARAAKAQRGTSPVDAEFLKTIEGWRATLAKNIAQLNPRLSLDEMNDAVQRTLDRIIFLRMAEDRGAEEYGRLLRAANPLAPAHAEHLRALSPEQIVALGALADTGKTHGGVYARLLALCRDADAKYNSGLFDFAVDPLTPQLKMDDDKLRGILAELYYPQSPYEFSVLAADTLGNVYEQFLGKVIRLTPSHQAKIEEKPAVKKAGGVFYTPAYIVEYIVAQTVGKMIEGKSPEELGGATLRGRPEPGNHIGLPLRVLDPACGSGSFLLGAYQCLLEHCLAWYVAHDAKRAAREGKIFESATGWRLTTVEKKRILTTHIFGVDIDRQAVEVAKLSLLLKVLEDETSETLGKQLALFKERALPNLDANIKCGNALIGADYFAGQSAPDADELRRVNPFDWGREFPDALRAGGFDVVIGNPPYGATLTSEQLAYLRAHFKIQNYQLDTYLLFVEKSLALLRARGQLGMIIPNTWLLNLQCKEIRRHMLNCTQIETIVHYRYPVFRATVDTEIVILENAPPAETHAITINLVEKGGTRVEFATPQRRWQAGDGKPVNVFARPEVVALVDKFRAFPLLDHLCVITQGAKPFQVGKGKPPQTRKIVETKPFVAETKHAADFRPLLRGSLIQRYASLWNEDYWIRFGDWLAEPRYSANYDAAEKIVVRQTGDSLVATLDRQQFIVRDNLYTIVPRQAVALPFILALLNSRLLNWVYQSSINPEQGEALAQIKRGHLAQLPIRAINFEDASDALRHRRIVALVEQMLELHKCVAATQTAHDREMYARQIAATDAEIDALVYALYGLTEEEIRVVEGEISDREIKM